VIRYANLSKSYGDTRVLGPLTGTIAKGGITALVGPNGAGKSTLLTSIGRLLEPDEGSIEVGGVDVRSAKPRSLATLLSILRQENTVTARLTVRELVSLGRFPYSRGHLTAADREKVDEALEFLNLSELAERYLDQLSGGQRQRAFVAMVIAQDTDYVLLDEPLNNLDMRHSVRMMQMLRRAADQLDKTIVLVVHDINFAAGYADNIIALSAGEVMYFGTVPEIMRDDVLAEVFETPVRVLEVDGTPVAVYHRPPP